MGLNLSWKGVDSCLTVSGPGPMVSVFFHPWKVPVGSEKKYITNKNKITRTKMKIKTFATSLGDKEYQGPKKKPSIL